ncbi:hypothetical protein [Mycobacterium intracellulare]|uniref:hypothetical protein n=1 Tax=Mycobacterium intracellulare TaxID=1767 RepID=UPI0011554EEE|nr:hypothetical protein [Mycobacterium intracellulare]
MQGQYMPRAAWMEAGRSAPAVHRSTGSSTPAGARTSATGPQVRQISARPLTQTPHIAQKLLNVIATIPFLQFRVFTFRLFDLTIGEPFIAHNQFAFSARRIIHAD